ncbi:MAG TPA: ABC transporter substrate-binding protein [Ramlibacter sp.]|uniref:ABC transporter substrate-binding protein n=1 Tax=Ramlibacter sp. TaxID=1917967 RepID=UPI002C14F709|nr:ABC transporter substrate-binding protein [Ramlibacter sp.]HVZ43644.1 ABC transporter substrate-binding protein [Ramlibacter sp.]
MTLSRIHRAFAALVLAPGLALALGSAGARTLESGVGDKEIVVGQSLGLTGPLGELGQDIANGARAYFDSVNAKGGINGRRIRVVTLDDGYKADNTVKNVEQMLGEDQVFCLFNIMGTPNSAAILPMVEKTGVPLFSPFTGAQMMREPALPGVFNIRAGYKDEIEKLVQHLSTVGIRRLSVVWQANAFGKEGLANVQAAMAKRGLTIHSSASIQTDASDARAAVAALNRTTPEAVIMITAGKPTFEFIKTYNKARRGMQFYTLSVMGAQASIKALGTDGAGVVVASVVPFPWSLANPLANEYRSAMNEIGQKQYSFVSFESYINAKTLGEAIRRAGKNPTRAGLVVAAEGMRNVDLGGFDVGFSKDNHQASHFVELTIITPDGRFNK